MTLTEGLAADLINKYSILIGAKYLSSNRLHNYLVFVSTRLVNFISKASSDRKIELWGSTGILQESIKNLDTSDITFAPNLIDDHQFSKVEYKGVCLKQDSEFFLHKKVVYIFHAN